MNWIVWSGAITDTRAMTEAFVHPFPMIRAGGAFLMTAGAVFALGWLHPRRFALYMIAAFALAGTAAWLAPQLVGPFFGPSPGLHVAVLIAAIVVEAIAIAWLYRRVKDERRADAWMLMVVGAHFLPMAILLGPLAIGLAAACMANAALALRAENRPITPYGLADSAIKIGFGAAMFFFYPAWMGWMGLGAQAGG